MTQKDEQPASLNQGDTHAQTDAQQADEGQTATTAADTTTNGKKRKKTEARQRPDPAFKRLLERFFEKRNIKSKATELKSKQLTSPDLLLEVPPGTNLENTVFDFFRRYTIIEFKSRNDTLTLAKFRSQLGRVHIWAGEHEEVAEHDILNLIVSARNPQSLRHTLEARGLKFELLQKNKTGIYSLHLELQDIILIVCSELPVEPEYAELLLFADANTETWRKAMRMMADNHRLDLLEEAEKLYPKEYRTMSSEIEERLGYYTLEEMDEVEEAVKGLVEDRLKRLRPDQRVEVLARLSPEERLKGLPPEKIMQAVPIEERLKGVSPEERLKGLPPEERVKELTPEEKRRLLKQLQQELGETE